MSDTKVLFSKSSSLELALEQQEAESSSNIMDPSTSSNIEKPPTYEESCTVKQPFSGASTSSGLSSSSSSSKDVSSSVNISMEKLPSTLQLTQQPTVSITTGSGNLVDSVTGSTISVDQMQNELSALKRAQIHLYKRLQHVKSQTYAALACVLLMAGLIILFLATYQQHPDPNKPSPVLNHRAGKALVGSVEQARPLYSGNSILGESTGTGDDQDDAHRLLLQHLAKIASASSTTSRFFLSPDLTTGRPMSTVISIDSRVDSGNTNRNDNNDAFDLQLFKNKNQAVQTETTAKTTSGSSTVTSSSSTSSISTTEQTSTTPISTTISTSTMTTTHDDTTSTTTETASTGTSANVPVKVPLQDSYNISIIIHSATVPNMDYLPLGRASDTYCEVYLDDVLVGTTPIIDNNNNPSWQYILPKHYKVRKESSIRVDLLDRDHLKRDHIGGVVIMVGDLVGTERINRPVKLFHGRGDVWVTVKVI